MTPRNGKQAAEPNRPSRSKHDVQARFSELANRFEQLATTSHNKAKHLGKDLYMTVECAARLLLDAADEGYLSEAWPQKYLTRHGRAKFAITLEMTEKDARRYLWTTAIGSWLLPDYGSQLRSDASSVHYPELRVTSAYIEAWNGFLQKLQRSLEEHRSGKRMFRHTLEFKAPKDSLYHVEDDFDDMDWLARFRSVSQVSSDVCRLLARIIDNGSTTAMLTDLNGAPRSVPSTRTLPPVRNDDADPNAASSKNALALDDEEIKILRALDEMAPRLLTLHSLEAHTLCTRKLIGTRLTRLISLGIASRPNGARKGATITDEGRKIIARVDSR